MACYFEIASERFADLIAPLTQLGLGSDGRRDRSGLNPTLRRPGKAPIARPIL